jgi:hypothetical protein
MGRIDSTRREVKFVSEKLHKLTRGKADPEVTRAILKLKDLGLAEIDRVSRAALKGGAKEREVDRLAVFALTCKFLLIERMFHEANRYDKIVQDTQGGDRQTPAEKLAARNQHMVDEYQKLKPKSGCLKARKQLSEKWELSLRQVTKILRRAGIEIASS